MIKILRLEEIKNRTGLSRSSIYSMISVGSFPAQIPLGERAVGWVEEEISNWIRARIEQARGRGAAND